jgi:hypothetical protein
MINALRSTIAFTVLFLAGCDGGGSNTAAAQAPTLEVRSPQYFLLEDGARLVDIYGNELIFDDPVAAGMALERAARLMPGIPYAVQVDGAWRLAYPEGTPDNPYGDDELPSDSYPPVDELPDDDQVSNCPAASAIDCEVQTPVEPDDPNDPVYPATYPVIVQWAIPTQREDGKALPVAELWGYQLAINSATSSTHITIEGGAINHYALDLPPGLYSATMTAFDTDGRESTSSMPPVTVRVGPSDRPPGSTG